MNDILKLLYAILHAPEYLNEFFKLCSRPLYVYPNPGHAKSEQYEVFPR